ncbi:hypothetical protein LZK73_21975 [Neorhizobium galegae]|nr:hypothetical protein LZK73_21975 [Neorhizobium galegae]
MKTLHQRLTTMDNAGRSYILDYITMKNSFVYRNAYVLQHDEGSILIQQEGKHETLINIDEIASVQIIPT